MKTPDTQFDPVLLSVLANAFDGIVREMTNGLLRSGRSSVLNTARDFSCSILTADSQLLAAAEGAPVHVFGSEPLGESMRELQPDLAEGDAFLHNDPYRGNSHAADHSMLVPIFIGGRHLFTAVAKAHQADCGNALPTTYSATARDVYEEGALIFPCVRVQRDYNDIDDIIRMCRVRIRVPDQWYGDYLAMVGSARIAERRVQELADKHGAETLLRFVDEWFAYSERLAANVIGELPACTLHGSTIHDPFPGTDVDGVLLKAEITVAPEESSITIDLRDNPDNQHNGLNLTRATATAAAIAGTLSALPQELPSNAGTFRRFNVLLRDGCVVGIPKFPHSCSAGTTNFADRVVGLVQAAFADIGDEYGVAEGATGQAPAKGVISGIDERTGNPYVNQVLLGGTGGPATAWVDGWPTFQRPVAGALIYHDSVEIDEQRYPILVSERSLIADSGGAGRQRGGLATRVVFEPRFDIPVVVAYGLESRVNAPKGVRGGRDGTPANAWVQHAVTGNLTEAPTVTRLELRSGERIVSHSAGGGGYGDPLDRLPAAVFDDLIDGRISEQAALDAYGVIVDGGVVDESATHAERDRRRQATRP
ncbi:hydantoinase B/oxoprolinase family protein [Mycolicibacterium sp. P9-22]|uniref:hydantoinase B/oxoprolinase family protein n=1 Tax=Mycolicibacterium sp. P9-22 TaxID=2024613 RepID=UPI0011ECCB08|nr:hydantoinase B/oxoprolinase family protein [Mycolicibacterium sp. P9-22]KAA0109032.1 hydantoinase B/oxoprolinase family protein [Mycolicibacterium sp. P9-22]